MLVRVNQHQGLEELFETAPIGQASQLVGFRGTLRPVQFEVLVVGNPGLADGVFQVKWQAGFGNDILRTLPYQELAPGGLLA